MTNATIEVHNILPGWSLYRAQKDDPKADGQDESDWPQGWLGVVYCNDPLFVFPDPPKPPENDSNEWSEFDSMACEYNQKFGFSLDEGYRFIEACKLVGYNPDEDGFVMGWFLAHVYNTMHASS